MILLQTLSASIPTATESTGSFRRDFAGRGARTGAFVQRQNLGSMTDELFVTPFTRELIDATITLRDVPSRPRAAIRPFLLATLDTVPDEWHDLLAPGESRLEERLAAQAVQTPFALMQLLLGRGEAVDVAHARVASAS